MLAPVDWADRDLGEITRFFEWMDALHREAVYFGLDSLFDPDQLPARLSRWLTHFDQGLTPLQALKAQEERRQYAS